MKVVLDKPATVGAAKKGVLAAGGIAATAFPAATEAAVAVLRSGGNAMDAAVAAAWVLAVGEPSGSGLGGKTVILLRSATGKTTVIDGRSQAPAAVTKKLVNQAQQKSGCRASSVPTTVAVLARAQEKYGTLPMVRLLAPALRLAEDGFPLTALHCRQLKWCHDALRATPATKRIFLQDGELHPPGTIFRQPALAKTLERLVQAGTEDFYLGAIARDIIYDMNGQGGLMTLADLAECAQPVECAAISARYRSDEVFTAPPPAGGLQLLLALKLLECVPSEVLGGDEADRYEAVARVVQAVFREREIWSVTPQTLTPSFTEWMLSEARAAEIFARMHEDPADLTADDLAEDDGPGETTHLCTADRAGNVVSLTQSIQSLFGAKVMNEKLGFLYNNCLCTCPRYEHPYQLAGRCLPRSNMAPTIILREGRPFLALGAAGSRRIISSLLQVISGVVDNSLSLAEAVGRGRIHVTLRGVAHLEKTAATPRLLAALARRYRDVRIRARRSYFMGAVQALQFSPAGECVGAADPRRDGTAGGA